LFSGGYQWTITLLKAKTKALSIKQTSSCSYLLVGENFDRERPFLELESSITVKLKKKKTFHSHSKESKIGRCLTLRGRIIEAQMLGVTTFPPLTFL